MTRDRDIERVLDRFYAEGPSEMPDRVFLGVFDRIERVPQRRLALQLTRFATMNPNLRLAAAAVIVVAAVGIGALALSQKSLVGPQPTSIPSPTAGQTVGPSLASLPAALRYKWVGEPRTVAQIVPPISCSRLLLGSGQLQFNGCRDGDPILNSTVGVASSSSIVFTLNAAENGCAAGDVGTYSFVVSPNGKGLSLVTVEDACAARAGAISGEWDRSDCQDPNSPCLGALDPGTYSSANFNPFVPSTAWVANYGALSYTVPAGWANIEDCDACFTLAEQGAAQNEAISLFSDVAAHLQGADCTNAVAPGIGQSASAISTWLTTLPGLVATAPTATTIGGLSGYLVDVSLDPAWTQTCPYSGGDPTVPLFTSALGGGFDWGVGGDGRSREILLDLPDGRVLLVDVGASTQSAFDTLVADAIPVIQNFQFKP